MENLWKRLKPAVKKQILAEEDQYPYMVNSLKNELKTNSFWTDLPIGTARQIINFSDDNLWKLDYTDIMWGEKWIKKA